jgi:hypothetical protein
MSNILNEINIMKYLTHYKRGVVISEQENSLNEGDSFWEKIGEKVVEKVGSAFGSKSCILDFQNWVKDVKKDPKVLGPAGADGDWGPSTKTAFNKYGTEYGNLVISKKATIEFQNYVKNVKKDSPILGSAGADGDWGPSTKKAWAKYGASYISSNCVGGSSSSTDKDTKGCKNVKIKNFDKINTCLADSTKSVKLGTSSVTDCAAFVNAFSDKVSYVGNAWFTHDLDGAGKRKFSVYTSVPDSVKQGARRVFNSIWKRGGWAKANDYSQNIKNLQSTLIPNQSSLKSYLAKGDIVGIYYPKSTHHVEAFYQAATGKDGSGNQISSNYVKTDTKGKMLKGSDGFPALGKTWQSGRVWSFNTHLGIVGDIKNGVPIIFHNIGGTVWADPLGKLQGDGKIMWIKQP